MGAIGKEVALSKPTDYNETTGMIVEHGGIVMTVLDYRGLLEQASRLSQQEKTDLLAELAGQVRDDNRKGKKRSIMELEGLGKEIWAGIDAREYVNAERASWDG
jgi:hypothetical protein